VKGGARQKCLIVTAAVRLCRSAGHAAAVSVSVRHVWRKISGECHATASSGNARTAVSGTDTEISDIFAASRSHALRGNADRTLRVRPPGLKNRSDTSPGTKVRRRLSKAILQIASKRIDLFSAWYRVNLILRGAEISGVQK